MLEGLQMAQPTLEGAWEMEAFVPEVIISAERCVSARVRLQSAPKAGRRSAPWHSHHLPGSCIHRSSFILQVANGRVQSLEATVEKLLTSESKLKQATLALELERSALLQTVEQLQRQMVALGSRESDPTLPKPSGD